MRPAPAYHKGRLPGAPSVPLAGLAGRLTEIPSAGRVILDGQSIIESSDAHRRLRDLGNGNTGVLEDGFAGWPRQHFPGEPGR